MTTGLTAASCTKPNPAATCDDGKCSDGAFPFCDADGVIDGEPNSCIAVSCTPNAFAACDGSSALACNSSGDDYEVTPCTSGCSADNSGCNECTAGDTQCGSAAVQTCGSDGQWVDSEACELSCTSTPAAHCAYISPRYLPDVCDTPAGSGALDLLQPETLDSDFDANCTGGIVTQAGAPSLCVVRASTITIGSDAKITITSSVNTATVGSADGREIVFVADGDVVVEGTLDASANLATNGPGGGVLNSGDSSSGDIGLGGAGFQTAGGAGGSTSANGGADNGGAATPDPALQQVLLGGPTGGAGNRGGLDGGGGGVVALISCKGSITVSGVITTAGGGGLGGGVGFPLPGGGGGAGGYVVLQAVRIGVTGEIYANGGGGGGGAGSGTTSALRNGENGSSSDSVAATGGTASTGAGVGGAGGLIGSIPGEGGRSVQGSGTPGGGGGSVGFFQTYTPSGVTPTLTPSHASPGFQPNANVPTR